MRWLAILVMLSAPLAAVSARDAAPPDIARLEQALVTQPDNTDAMQTLASALLAESRIAPSVERLARAQVLVDRLLALHAPRADALDAWRLLILHHFDEALTAARRARTSNAEPLLAALCEADALTELGRYEEAEIAVQGLLDAHYGSAALSRASHLRRLFGDLPGAIELAEAAQRLSAGEADRAWLSLDLAELQLMAGRPQLSLALAKQAVAALPTPALAMQARAHQALGDNRAALALYRVAAARSPRVEYEVEVLRLAQGLAEVKLQANTARLLDGMARLAALGSGGDRRAFIEFHLLRAQLPAAVTLARAEWRERPDIYSAAQLAWALFRADQRDEAGVFAARAIAMHTADPLLQWRAGTVLKALGDARGAHELAAGLNAQPWLAQDSALLARQP